jgi:hypothetical protein
MPRGPFARSWAHPSRGGDEVDRTEFDDAPLTRHADGDDDASETSGAAEIGIP